MNAKNKTGGEIKNFIEIGFNQQSAFLCTCRALVVFAILRIGNGTSFFDPDSVMMAFSWSILMSLNVVFSNVWGIILKEWVGAGKKAVFFLAIGMATLIFALIIPNLFR